MNLLDRALTLLDARRPAPVVHAHCDVPCGIYSAEPARLAASTANNMIIKAHQLERPAADASKEAWLEYENTLGRYIAHKEEHCQLFKKEIYILWSDFLQPFHFENRPQLHDTFWNAVRAGGKAKKSMKLEDGQALVQAANEMAELFKELAAEAAAAAGRTLPHKH